MYTPRTVSFVSVAALANGRAATSSAERAVGRMVSDNYDIGTVRARSRGWGREVTELRVIIREGNADRACLPRSNARPVA